MGIRYFLYYDVIRTKQYITTTTIKTNKCIHVNWYQSHSNSLRGFKW